MPFLPILFIGLPIALPILLIVHLRRRQNIFKTWVPTVGLVVGLFFSFIFFELGEYCEWYVVERRAGCWDNTPLSMHHVMTPITLFILSIIGFLTLTIFKKSPPIISALCISSLLIGFLMTILYLIQVGSDINLIHFYIINVWLIYLLAVRQKSRELAIMMREKADYKKPVLRFCRMILEKSVNWVFLAFILMFPIVIIAIIILTLFGQQPDSLIQTFTYTADWTLSQHVSPPVTYSGHYLCTVAAQGDPNLVKPIRHGLRHGHKIIVNRQLCIANAFEQYIMEKAPRSHRIIRGIYDKYGYPLSQHITTTKRANLTYILMKPIEWVFLIFLYTFDKNPEERITNQYRLEQLAVS